MDTDIISRSQRAKPKHPIYMPIAQWAMGILMLTAVPLLGVYVLRSGLAEHSTKDTIFGIIILTWGGLWWAVVISFLVSKYVLHRSPQSAPPTNAGPPEFACIDHFRFGIGLVAFPLLAAWIIAEVIRDHSWLILTVGILVGIAGAGFWVALIQWLRHPNDAGSAGEA